jgi:hypothetical protein
LWGRNYPSNAFWKLKKLSCWPDAAANLWVINAFPWILQIGNSRVRKEPEETKELHSPPALQGHRSQQESPAALHSHHVKSIGGSSHRCWCTRRMHTGRNSSTVALHTSSRPCLDHNNDWCLSNIFYMPYLSLPQIYKMPPPYYTSGNWGLENITELGKSQSKDMSLSDTGLQALKYFQSSEVLSCGDAQSSCTQRTSSAGSPRPLKVTLSFRNSRPGPPLKAEPTGLSCF